MLARCREKPKKIFVGELWRLSRKAYRKPWRLGFSEWREVR